MDDAFVDAAGSYADGNVALNGTYTYKWDFQNRLTRVDNASDGELVIAYGYDAFTRGVLKAVRRPEFRRGR